MTEWIQTEPIQWEKVHKGRPAKSLYPAIRVSYQSFDKTGRIVINKFARERMDNPKFIEVYIAKDASAIKIVPCSTPSPDAYIVGAGGQISCKDLVSRLNLQEGESRMGQVSFDGTTAIVRWE